MYRVTIDDLQQETREKIVIDIRAKADYEKETYPGAIHLFWEEFDAHMDEIPKDKPVYLICYTGLRSDEIAERWNEKGYELYSLDGGFYSWRRVKLLQFMKEELSLSFTFS